MTNNGTKVTVPIELDIQIETSLKQVNENFNGGRVTKSDFVAWLVKTALSTFGEADIELVRQAYFNQAAYLQNILSQLRQEGRRTLNESEMDQVKKMSSVTSVAKPMRKKRRPVNGAPIQDDSN